MRDPGEVFKERQENDKDKLVVPLLQTLHQNSPAAASFLRGYITGLQSRIFELQEVMVAAAEEIKSHWDAHCDKDGYGPVNLIRRLETALGCNYPGYSAGEFAKMQSEIEHLRAERSRLESIARTLVRDPPDIDPERALFRQSEEISRLRKDIARKRDDQ